MKKLIVLLFLCVNVCGYVFASQAVPGPYLRIQPNGDSIYVYFRGDEYGSFYTDLKGNVVDKNKEGYWVYVTMKKGKKVLTNQMVTETSTPKNVDSKGVSNYLAEIRRRNYERKGRYRGLPEFTIKNERVKKWINPKINWDNLRYLKCTHKDLSWLVSTTKFGKYDYSCLILCENDSTKEHCFVHYYVDFSTRVVDTHEITSAIHIYTCSRIFGGFSDTYGSLSVLDFNFFEQINVIKNKQVSMRVNKANRLFEKKYKQVDKLVKLTQERNKKYKYKEYSSCEYCENFFKTHTVIDVIGYSYIKYPMGIENKIK
jgi:hypothetical protein